MLDNAVRQFHQLKAKHPEFVLLFSVDGQYVAFDGDALAVIHQMGHGANQLTVTDDSYKMAASIPAADVEKCLRRMIAAGHKCAICEAVK